MMLLSGDRPRSRVLTRCAARRSSSRWRSRRSCFRARSALERAAKICVFIVLVASYDLLLGYTGIVSFAHTMFFGIGGYGVAIALYALGAELGGDRARRRGGAVAGRCCWRCVIGLFSLRVRAIFFAMITLAVASRLRDPGLAAVVAHRRRGRPHLPACRSCCGRAPRSFEDACSASPSTAALLTYYLVFVACAGAVPGAAAHRQLAVRPRAAGDPRERFPRRGARLPHRLYRTVANCLAARWRALAGALLALWLRYTGPDTTLSLRHHARHPADGRDRRHGHDVRRGASARRCSSWRRTICRPDGPRSKRHRGVCRCCRACCIPTAGCCGSASCSSSASISSRPASSAGLRNPSRGPS